MDPHCLQIAITQAPDVAELQIIAQEKADLFVFTATCMCD
eukprot:SAG11_NODE_1285_length_5300_cov_1.629494_5_plen_40_part_00